MELVCKSVGITYFFGGAFVKNIMFYKPSKYGTPQYREIAPNIYQHRHLFVTTLSFEQEPSLGEGKNAADISQFPLEDLLDRFCVHISDFYPMLNTAKSTTCHIEFAGSKKEYIQSLISIIGRRVKNKVIYENGEEGVVLIIE